MEKKICKHCEGTGKLRDNDINPPGKAIYKIHKVVCGSCNGTGKNTRNEVSDNSSINKFMGILATRL